MPIDRIHGRPNSAGEYHKAPRIHHATAATITASQLRSPSVSNDIVPSLLPASLQRTQSIARIRPFDEPLDPQPLVVAHPVVHLTQGHCVDRVEAETSLAADPDQPGFTQDP